MGSKKAYTADNIRTMEPLEHIRQRFEMYGGTRREDGIVHMIKEILDNAVDEFGVGYCTDCLIKINTKTQEIHIVDNGRGIPIGHHDPDGKVKDYDTLMRSISTPGTSGKFDTESYTNSVGLNGVGTKIVTACGIHTIRDVQNNGYKYACHTRLVFHKGIYQEKLTVHNNSIKPNTPITFADDKIFNMATSGTSFKFIPDHSVLGHTDLSGIHRPLHTMCSIVTAVAVGFRITVVWDGERTIYQNTEGLPGYLKSVTKSEKITPLVDNIEIKGTGVDSAGNPMGINAIINFSNLPASLHGSNKFVTSFVNYGITKQHGKHVDGVTFGVSRVITKYITDNGLIPKSAKYKINVDDIRDCIIGIISASKALPQFSGQTKEMFSCPEYYAFAAAFSYDVFMKWAMMNPSKLDKIAKSIRDIANAKFKGREKATESIKSDKSNRNSLSDSSMIKFTDCRSNKAEECELFIVEGDSAGGGMAKTCNSDTQAIFRLRGKPPNVMKGGKMNDLFESLVKALGCGSGRHKNLANLRFHTIVIMCDADSDGEHIKTMLYAFFWTYYPEFFDLGYIYITRPPLYRVKTKKSTIYVPNNKEMLKINGETAIQLCSLRTNKKVLHDDVFRSYIGKIMGDDTRLNFVEFMESKSTQCNNVNPLILEVLVRNLNDVVNGKFGCFKQIGYDVRVVGKNSRRLDLEFDNSQADHSFLRINKSLHENVLLPIANYLDLVSFTNVYLEHRESKHVSSMLTYDIARMVLFAFNNGAGSRCEIQRFKGLGQMNPIELFVNCIDKKTRRLWRVNVTDAQKAAYVVDTAAGNNIKGKRQWLEAM